MTEDTPTIIDHTPRPQPCSPDEWVRDAAKHVAAGVRLVVLDAIRDGPPWDDEAAVLDQASDTWGFALWPGVRFELPLEY